MFHGGGLWGRGMFHGGGLWRRGSTFAQCLPACHHPCVETHDHHLTPPQGGCFWCVEYPFSDLKGVKSATSGYIGGTVPNPTYEMVCSGTTGHAEAVRVVFDPSVVPFSSLLDVFFTVHDPTTLNRQGNDRGTQYRR